MIFPFSVTIGTQIKSKFPYKKSVLIDDLKVTCDGVMTRCCSPTVLPRTDCWGSRGRRPWATSFLPGTDIQPLHSPQVSKGGVWSLKFEEFEEFESELPLAKRIREFITVD